MPALLALVVKGFDSFGCGKSRIVSRLRPRIMLLIPKILKKHHPSP